MPLPALFALALFAADPQTAAPAQTATIDSLLFGAQDKPAPAPAAPPAAAEPPQAAAPAPAATEQADAAKADAATDDDNDGIPSNAPKDDYRFVAWCYGAVDEYLQIYETVKPDLKAIDKMFGSPVVEAEPYHEDIAEDRKALKRFAAAIEAAEKASPRPIAPEGAAALENGRRIWAAAKMQPHRKLADAWLFWGVPTRCDKVARTLKMKATLMGQAFAVDAPRTDQPAPPHPADPAPPAASTAPATAAPPEASAPQDGHL